MLGVEGWTELLVWGMYTNAGSNVRVGEGYSQEFEMKVGSIRAPYSVTCSSSA